MGDSSQNQIIFQNGISASSFGWQQPHNGGLSLTCQVNFHAESAHIHSSQWFCQFWLKQLPSRSPLTEVGYPNHVGESTRTPATGGLDFSDFLIARLKLECIGRDVPQSCPTHGGGPAAMNLEFGMAQNIRSHQDRRGNELNDSEKASAATS